MQKKKLKHGAVAMLNKDRDSDFILYGRIWRRLDADTVVVIDESNHVTIASDDEVTAVDEFAVSNTNPRHAMSNKWKNKRWVFNVCGVLYMALAVTMLMIPFAATYLTTVLQFTLAGIGYIVALVVTVRAMFKMELWEIQLDSWEKQHGLNTEWHVVSDEYERLKALDKRHQLS